MEEVDLLGVSTQCLYLCKNESKGRFFFSIRNCRLFYGKMLVKPISSDPTRHAHTILSKDCL